MVKTPDWQKSANWMVWELFSNDDEEDVGDGGGDDDE